MHAIICQGEGKYYVSAVFGCYRDITATDDYGKYMQRIYNTYWIVWDSEKKHLIKWLAYVPNTKYIIPQIIIIDTDQSNWRKDEKGIGCVDFLNRDQLDSFLDKDDQPQEILDRCRAMDEGYVYEEISEVRTEADIANLYRASGGFHDAFIKKEELMDDGTLYLRFGGTWGCEIEIWFSGDLEYDSSSRHSDEYDKYWYGSTLILQDGFVYLIDEDDMTVDEIEPGYCFFKARNMKYRIIPD